MNKLLSTLTATATFCFSPAFAGGLVGSYAGAGVSVGTDGFGTAGSLSGRVDIGGAPVSIRPQVTVGTDTGATISVTGDVGVAEGVNVFGGVGAGFGEGTALAPSNPAVAFLQVGAEGEVAKNVILFADFKLGLGDKTTYIPSVGVGYKF